MKKKQNNQPLLFVLEDDQIRSDRWKDLAKETDWNVEVRRSLESGLAFARRNAKRIRMAFIDNMLPMDDANLEYLDKLQTERSKLTEGIRFANRATRPNTALLRQLDAELAAIDSTWRHLIVLNGGLLFLDESAGAGWLKDWKYAVCSATDKIKGEKDMKDHGVLAQGEYLGWFTKPIDDEIIVGLLKAHRE